MTTKLHFLNNSKYTLSIYKNKYNHSQIIIGIKIVLKFITELFAKHLFIHLNTFKLQLYQILYTKIIIFSLKQINEYFYNL